MKSTKRLKNSVVTVGIIGSSRGVGTTHLSIMLAGFLSSKEHRKTALIELNHAGSFAALYDLCFEESSVDVCISEFNLNGVDFYCGKTMEEFARIFQMGYDYIVIDLGSEWEKNQYELLRCNVSCLIGSCTEWKMKKFEKDISYLQEISVKESIHFVKFFGSDELKKNIEKKYHIKIKTVPYEVTPFLLHKESFAFFEQLCC